MSSGSKQGHLGEIIDRGAALAKDLPRLGQQHAHADLFQNHKRCLVNHLDFVGRKQLHRRP